MLKREDKRGQGLSTSAIVLIVLGVVVLAVLIIGFTIGWGKLAPWLNSSGNVDTIVQQCNVACTSGSTYDYCNLDRTLTDENKNTIKTTCAVLAYEPGLHSKYGVATCNMNCQKPCNQIMINDVAGSTTLTKGTYNVLSLDSDHNTLTPKDTNCFIK